MEGGGGGILTLPAYVRRRGVRCMDGNRVSDEVGFSALNRLVSSFNSFLKKLVIALLVSSLSRAGLVS